MTKARELKLFAERLGAVRPATVTHSDGEWVMHFEGLTLGPLEVVYRRGGHTTVANVHRFQEFTSLWEAELVLGGGR